MLVAASHNSDRKGDPRPSAAGARHTRGQTVSHRGRKCVGCGEKVPLAQVRDELIRLVLVPGPSGISVAVDLAQRSVGRGAWVHARRRCVTRAVSKGLARAAKARVVVDQAQLERQIEAAARRRLAALVNSAVRRKQLAVGTVAVRAGWAKGRVKLLLVARDARAAADRPETRAAVSAGIAVPWGTKEGLAALVAERRAELGVVGVMSDSIASSMRRAIALVEIFGRRAKGGNCPRQAPSHHERDVCEHPFTN